MGKRRTKEDKKNAKRPFAVTWKNKSETGSSEASVKGQFKNGKKSGKSGSKNSKKAKHSAKDGNLDKIKRDIIKSLILAAFLLGLEVVLYLSWNPS